MNGNVVVRLLFTIAAICVSGFFWSVAGQTTDVIGNAGYWIAAGFTALALAGIVIVWDTL